MTPEQLSWTDEQWASHLQWDVRDIPALRQYITENFFPVISCDIQSGKYFFHITKLDVAPSGAKRTLPLLSSNKEFDSYPRAAKYANEEILPRIELTPFRARIMGVPERALQMLHIHNKQK